MVKPPVSIASVWPSGADFDTMLLPWTPMPWVTLSTITGWPSRSVSLLPSVRDTMSGLPPGEVGMMIRSGRVGQLGACARAADTVPSAATPESNVLRVNDILLFPSRSRPEVGFFCGGCSPPFCDALLRTSQPSSSGRSTKQMGADASEDDCKNIRLAF